MAFRASSIAQGTGGTITPSLPTGTLSTDIVIAAIGSVDTAMTVSPPSGWTLIREQDETGGFYSTSFMYWALGSVASTAFGLSGSSNKSVVLASFSGRNTTTPITTSNGNQGNNTSAVLPSVTAVANDDLFCVYSSEAFSGTGSPPSPWTTASSASLIRTGYQDAVSAGSSAASSLTLPYTEAWTTIVVAIAAGSSATTEQEGFRWGVDDGSESAHTWEAAQDTNITLPDTQSRLVRVLVNATDDPSALAYTLRYQKNGSGGYAAVPVGSGTPEMTGAPAYSALGAGANVTTSSGSLNVSYPSMTGATTDTALYLVVTGRHSTANTAETVPSGWTLVDSLEGGTGTYGADAGTRRVAVYRKDSVSGSESGTIAVSYGGTTSSTTYGSIVRVDSPGAGYVLTQASADGADTSAGTAVSIAASASLSYVVDDLILVCHASPSDTGGVVNSPTLTATGQTFGSLTSRASIAVTGGNDHRHVIYSAVVTAAGSDSAPTFAYTASGTNSGNASGPAVFVRVRATKAAVSNEVYVATSSNIASGGEATTARLTAPSGKTTSDFVTGRRWDDENGTDTLDITTDDYTEVEWCVALSSAPSDGDYFDFRVYAGSTALDTYTQTPRWTVGTAGPAASFVFVRSIAPLLLH